MFDFLPPSERSITDVIAGTVTVKVDGEPYVLPVLSIADNEAWQKSVGVGLVALLRSLDKGADASLVFAHLQTATGDWLEFLRSYDQTGVLPKGDALKSIRPIELLMDVAEVWRAANPLVDVGLALARPESSTPTSETDDSSRPTSSPPMNGAGEIPASSDEPSPMSSSSDTSRPPTIEPPTGRKHGSKPRGRASSSPTTRPSTPATGAPLRGRAERRRASRAQRSSAP